MYCNNVKNYIIEAPTSDSQNKKKMNEFLPPKFLSYFYIWEKTPAISTFEGSVVGYKFGNNCCRRLSNLHHFLGHSCRNNEEVEYTLQQRLQFKENYVQFV